MSEANPHPAPHGNAQQANGGLPQPPGDLHQPRGDAQQPSGDLQQAVARSSDAAGLHATVPALLLESQTGLGALAATVTAGTERGRVPFRPDPEWASRLGEVAYGLFLLADQSGVDLEDAVLLTARHIQARGRQAQEADDTSWPFETR